MRIKKNRRSANTKYKWLRVYQSDIWGRIAQKKRNTFITRRMAQLVAKQIQKELRNYPKAQKKEIEKRLGRYYRNHKRQNTNFKLAINLNKQQRPTAFRGALVKLRRLLSLYYGAGRIRSKSWRRYTKFSAHRNYKGHLMQSTFGKLPTSQSFGHLLEARIDVLLVRAKFLDTIKQARQFILHGKVYSFARTLITAPGQLIRNWLPFRVLLRPNFSTSQRKKFKLTCGVPSYLHVNFALRLAFRIEDPITHLVGYPFLTPSGSLAIFRKAFRLL